MSDKPSQNSGLAMIEYEMGRQNNDALQSFQDAQTVAAQIAESIRRTGKLALLGMGGSHWVNRAAMFAYRELGIEVQAEVLSEVILAPLPDTPRTVLLTSQSGNSGEISRYLEILKRTEDHFGLTLNAQSVLAQKILCLIGAGGVEKAFAATRSIFVSHALHLAVLSALGYDVKSALHQIQYPKPHDIREALSTLSKCSTLILTGRGELQGVAESGALCLMELARMSIYALEGGQLRHGPMEMLSEKTGIIILRSSGVSAQLVEDLAMDCKAAGATIVVFDLSGSNPIANTPTINFAALDGMAAIFAVLPALQSLLVSLANSRVANVGQPLRSSKVTTKL
jgi:fructoselysine-6-P-deglycase FrlB-like protein